MEILKIYLEEQLLIKYYVIKHLILLKILDMVGDDGYQRDLGSMVYKSFDKKTTSLAYKSAACGAVKNKIMQNNE